MAEKAKKTTEVKDLVKYEYAGLAGIMEASDQNRRPYAGVSMLRFYHQFDIDNDDPIIHNAINTGAIKEAIALYAARYEEKVFETKVSDFVQYANDKGYELPKDLADAIKKYKDMTIKDVAKRIKDDEEAKRVIEAVGFLKTGIMEGTLYGNLVRENVEKGLESLVAKKD